MEVRCVFIECRFVTQAFRGAIRNDQISIDAFPGQTIDGTVDSLAPGTGAQFALLPPENATGNFTKIVQRVPVKILLDAKNPLTSRLRPGLSVTATVDIHERQRSAVNQAQQ